MLKYCFLWFLVSRKTLLRGLRAIEASWLSLYHPSINMISLSSFYWTNRCTEGLLRTGRLQWCVTSPNGEGDYPSRRSSKYLSWSSSSSTFFMAHLSSCFVSHGYQNLYLHIPYHSGALCFLWSSHSISLLYVACPDQTTALLWPCSCCLFLICFQLMDSFAPVTASYWLV